MDQELMPFGKYKGQSIEQVALRDPQYIQWLTQQSWFQEKPLYQVIINQFAMQEEHTPEHNKLQAKFLEDDICCKIACYLDSDLDPTTFHCTNRRMEYKDWDVFIEYEGLNNQKYCSIENEKILNNAKRIHAEEYQRVQKGRPLYDDKYCERMQKQADEQLQKVVDAIKLTPRSKTYGNICIECKTSVGDDYPAILRTVSKRPSRGDVVLFSQQFSASSVIKEQVKKMFRLSGIVVIFAEELGL